MKREIKFRAFAKVEKKMCEVTTLTDKGAFLIGVEPGADQYLDGGKYIVEACKDGRFLNFGEFEIMQFTGLHDKNGKEIYEGDVVKTTVHVCINKNEVREAEKNNDLFVLPEFKMEDRFCQIDWFNGVRVSGWRLLGKDKRYQTQLKWSTIGNMQIEVIGNIYENPELL